MYAHTGVLRSGRSPIGEAHGAGQGCVPVLPLDQCDMHSRPDPGSLPQDHPGSGVVALLLPPGQLHGISSASPSLPCCPVCCVCGLGLSQVQWRVNYCLPENWPTRQSRGDGWIGPNAKTVCCFILSATRVQTSPVPSNAAHQCYHGWRLLRSGQPIVVPRFLVSSNICPVVHLPNRSFSAKRAFGLHMPQIRSLAGVPPLSDNER